MTLNTPNSQRDTLLSNGKLLLATHNTGKLRELQNLLKDTPLNLHSLSEFDLPAPEETGTSFFDNAKIKADAAGTATQMWVLADDSGLMVDALHNAPGVDTAHYGGWKKLLDALSTTPLSARGAHFACVLVLRAPDGSLLRFDGECHGTITEHPVGEEGFGFDPVFTPLGADTTFANMPLEIKQTLSHRGKALQAFLSWLKATS